MKIKKSPKRSVKASKRMKLGRKITASTGKKIPYDLVSMAAILRDWADMPRDAYASDDHKLLADIADTLYNVGRSAAKTFKNEYAELYKQYGEAYFDQVLDDMAALDSQVSSNNIEELVEDYEDRLDSGIGAATKIRASRKTAKRPIKASMPIMAGPGAGYTIEWSLERVRKVNSFDVVDVSKPDKYGTVEVTVDCDVECDVTIKSAWSYMYGFNHPIEGVPAKITRVIFDYNIVDGSGGRIDPDDYEDGTDDKEFIDEVMNFVYQLNEMDGFNIFDEEAAEVISGDEFTYGGGYVHSNWDGTLLEVGEYTYADIQVTDKMIIDYVDSAVTNENLVIEYWIKVADTGRNAYDEFYESEESAREDAISMLKAGDYDDSDLIIMKTEWKEILLDMEGSVDLDDPYDEEVETLYHDDYAEEPDDDED